jgi:hypothetical protein
LNFTGENDMEERFLGDGLFASYDGFMVKLRTPRLRGDHEVFLEPCVLAAFLDFVEDIKKGQGVANVVRLGPNPSGG